MWSQTGKPWKGDLWESGLPQSTYSRVVSSGEWLFSGSSLVAWLIIVAFYFLLGHVLVRGAGGLWIQLGISWTAVLCVATFFPLGSRLALAGVLSLSLIPVGAVAFVRRRKERPPVPWQTLQDPRLWAWCALVVGVGAFMSVQVSGSVAAFDSGLYHLSTINQARDYGVIQGVANLYFPYGYHNSFFPYAGFLSELVASEQGFRLVNGMLLLLSITDLAYRVWRRLWTPGTVVLAFGIASVTILTLPFGAAWLTSPTPDTAVFILYVVFSAYFAEALFSVTRTRMDQSFGIALIVGVIASTVRPLYILPLALALVIFLVVRRKSGEGRGRAKFLTCAFVLAAVTTFVALVRDVFASGWLWYPLGIFSVPVPWAATSPGADQFVTLAFTRLGFASENYLVEIDGWNWIVPWVREYLPANAGTVILLLGLLALAAAAAVVYPATRRRAAIHEPGKLALVLALIPSVGCVVAWFLATPPAFRFIWGPLFCIPVIILAWSMANKPVERLRPLIMRGTAGLLSLVLVVSGVSAFLSLVNSRNEPLQSTQMLGIGSGVRAVPKPSLTAIDLDSGIRIYAPGGPTFQCWGEILCSPKRAPGIDGRSSDPGDGFANDLN